MSRSSYLLAVVLTTVVTNALAGAPDPMGGTGGPSLAGTLTVRVVEAGTTTPIQGAWVLVGVAENDPFPGNIGFTDAGGEVTFSGHPALEAPITVTAGDLGRSYVTIVGVGAAEVVLPLGLLDPPSTALIGDQFTGIEVDNGSFCLGDGNLDVGIVLPTLSVEQALSGDALSAISPTNDVLSTPLGDTLIPSNVYVPTQCELFQTFAKESYSLRVPTGRRSLFGVSVRAPLSEVLDALEIIDLIRLAEFRELDVLRDQEITVDSNTFDLDANVPVQEDLTLQIANGLAGTDVLAAAVGRIFDLDGHEELLATGVDGFDPDVDGPSGTLVVATTAAVGELSDLIHGVAVSMLADSGSGATTALVRSGFTPPATLDFNQFYDIVQIDSPDNSKFSWSNVESGTSPGPPDLNVSRIVYVEQIPNPDDPAMLIPRRTNYWTIYSEGVATFLTLPALPASAPTEIPDPGDTADADIVVFEHSVRYLSDDPDGFDYDGFALVDASDFATHVSLNDLALRCDSTTEITGVLASKLAGTGEVTLTWEPSTDVCRDTISGRAYEVYAGNTPMPLFPPGSFPDDPPLVKVTDADLDGNLANESFTHVPSGELVVYIVVDRGTSGNDGPAGHYE